MVGKMTWQRAQNILTGKLFFADEYQVAAYRYLLAWHKLIEEGGEIICPVCRGSTVKVQDEGDEYYCHNCEGTGFLDLVRENAPDPRQLFLPFMEWTMTEYQWIQHRKMFASDLRGNRKRSLELPF